MRAKVGSRRTTRRQKASRERADAHAQYRAGERGEAPWAVSIDMPFATRNDEDEKPEKVYVKNNYPLLFFVFASYLAVGAVIYMTEEDWTFIDSIYFGVVTVTTVGYGDLTPTKAITRVATVVYAFVGIGFISVALHKMSRGLLSAHTRAKARHDTAVTDSIEESISEIETGRIRKTLNLVKEVSTTTTENLAAVPKCIVGWVAKITCCFVPRCLKFHVANLNNFIWSMLPLMVFIIFFALCMMSIEPEEFAADAKGGYPAINALYFAFITVTSIGYGDFSPRTQGGRLFAFFFIPIGVTLLAKAVASILVGSMTNKYTSKVVTLRKLQHVRGREEGKVDEAEYLEYMLVSLGRVDSRTMSVLRKQFFKLSENHPGSLQIDLKALAEEAGVKDKKAITSPKAKSGRGSTRTIV